MIDTGKAAALSLLETGSPVPFRVVDTDTGLSPDKENVFVRADLVLEGDEDGSDPEEIVEWAAFGFLFALATLSFRDARPRGMSEREFEPEDAFAIADSSTTYRLNAASCIYAPTTFAGAA
jgi:hypothetical protein